MSFQQVFLVVFTFIALAASGSAISAGAPLLAVIIDDLGYELKAGQRVVNLPGPVACAILPSTPSAKRLAEAARVNGKEVLLHLPLQAQKNDGTVEPGGLLLDMSRSQFAETFAADIEAVPHAVGVNSHRGSMLTRHPGHMSWLMEEISARGNLFFVDSYTTAESVALQIAQEAGIPATRRDVFLDPDRSPDTLVREFARLKKLALETGFAVGIGHPYPATLDFLEQELPGLRDDGFELISISRMVALRNKTMAEQQ
jgi:polysaccharide deacetylase 2 family uncharacterized protein YibQ